MPHADAIQLPSSIASKTQFWEHIYVQLVELLDGQRNWVSNLANASALLYHSLQSYDMFGDGNSGVNWCGFYLQSAYLPPTRSDATKKINGINGHSTSTKISAQQLLLGPFSGKPACQFIRVPIEAKDTSRNITGAGVCADVYFFRTTLVVPNVDLYEGHIACDGATKSEIVIPVFGPNEECVGVLDLDCLAENGFDEEDARGLGRIAQLVGRACDWTKLQ